MIQEDYISFETAKLLKEKGFVVPYDSFRGVYINGKFLRRNPGQSYLCNMGDEIIDVCSIQMAIKWLRENKKVFISIGHCEYPTEHKITWIPEITTFDSVFPDSAIEYATYEEAAENAIRYSLENLI